MERISTATSGACRLISRVACSPVRFGIFTSRIARSGRSRIARSRASAPSAASATTSMSGWRSSNSRSPDRTIPWSSAISTFIWGPPSRRLCRDGEADGGAGAGAGLEGQLAVDQEGALAHAADAEAAVGLVEGEATAVVEDVDLALPRPVAQRHGAVLGTGVARGVRERLLGDPVDDQLGIVAEVGEIA